MNEYFEFRLTHPVAWLPAKPSYSVVLSDTSPEDVRSFVERLLTRLLKERKLNGGNLDQELMDRLIPLAANKTIKGITRFSQVGFGELQSYTFENLYDLSLARSNDEQRRVLGAAVASERAVTFVYESRRQRVNTVYPVKLEHRSFIGFHAGGFRRYSYEKIKDLKLSTVEAVDDEGRFVEPEVKLHFDSSYTGFVHIGAYRRTQEKPLLLTPFTKDTLKSKKLWHPSSFMDRLS